MAFSMAAETGRDLISARASARRTPERLPACRPVAQKGPAGAGSTNSGPRSGPFNVTLLTRCPRIRAWPCDVRRRVTVSGILPGVFRFPEWAAFSRG